MKKIREFIDNALFFYADFFTHPYNHI